MNLADLRVDFHGPDQGGESKRRHSHEAGAPSYLRCLERMGSEPHSFLFPESLSRSPEL